MGNHRFRLSDMMPNAWFYKLKDMSTRSSTRIHNPTNSSHHTTKKSSSSQKPRKSITIHHNTYTTTSHNYNTPKTYNLENNTHNFPYDPHRKSSKKRPKRNMPSPTQQQQPPPASYLDDFPSSPDQNLSEFDYSDSSQSFKLLSCHDNDIIIDVGSDFSPDLPQVRTKPTAKPDHHISLEKKCQVISNNSNTNSTRRISPSRRSVSRVKIRGKVAARKSAKGGERKALFGSESYAVVKASFDPESDFRASMMEMIVENNIRASKDLEDLLACYLSLNSDQYHQLIIKAFEQIWFNVANQLPH